MPLSKNISDRERDKFEENSDGNTAVRVIITASDSQPITNLLLSSADVDSGSIVGTVVGSIVTEGGVGPFLYTITSDPDDKFAISGSNLVTDNPVDYFTKELHNVTIKVTDLNNAEFEKSFIITINQTPAVPFVDNKAVQFNGTTQFMDAPYDAAVSGRTKLTVSAWIHLDSIGGEKTIASHFGAAGARGFRFNVGATGRMFIGLSENGSAQENFTGTTVLAVDTVYHVAFAFDGDNNTIKTWVNGVIDIDTTTTYNSLHDVVGVPFRIGARGDSSFPETAFFPGWINEVSFNEDALTTLRINEIYNFGTPADVQNMTSSSSLLLWLRMGDGDTFPTIADQVNSVDFTMQNMTAINIVDINFVSAFSLNFNGVDERLDTALDLSGKDKFTIAGWFYRDLTSQRVDISQSNIANTNRVKLIRNTTAVYLVVDGAARQFTDNSTGWIFIVGVFDGTQVAVNDRAVVYANGVTLVPSTSPAMPTVVSAIDQDLKLGYDQGSGNYSVGNLDEVVVFDTALTAGEATELYHGGVVYNYTMHSKAADIISYWRMGEDMVGSNVPDQVGSNDATGVNVDETNKDSNIP